MTARLQYSTGWSTQISASALPAKSLASYGDLVNGFKLFPRVFDANDILVPTTRALSERLACRGALLRADSQLLYLRDMKADH